MNNPISNTETSNNQLLKKFYDEVDIPPEKAWEDWEVGKVCQLCSLVIEGDRNKLVEHLYAEHKPRINEFKLSGE